METITYRPIGVIRTPFAEPAGMPIQPPGATGVLGVVEVEPAYEEGLRDLEGFSHIILLYHFHRGEGFSLCVAPFLDSTRRGLFSTRAPRRPNAIGLSVVRLHAVEGRALRVEGVDMLDGTPLLDIKPYVPRFDCPEGDVRAGWLEPTGDSVRERRSDDRFA